MITYIHTHTCMHICIHMHTDMYTQELWTFCVESGRTLLGNLHTHTHTHTLTCICAYIHTHDRLAGLVVKASTSRVEDPGFASRLRWDFSGSSHTSDFKTGTPVATLPGAWRYRVSAGTGWPGVSILWLGEMESLICNFYLSVAARKIVEADLSLRYTRILLGR